MKEDYISKRFYPLRLHSIRRAPSGGERDARLARAPGLRDGAIALPQASEFIPENGGLAGVRLKQTS